MPSVMSLFDTLRSDAEKLGVSELPSVNEIAPLLGALIKHLETDAENAVEKKLPASVDNVINSVLGDGHKTDTAPASSPADAGAASSDSSTTTSGSSVEDLQTQISDLEAAHQKAEAEYQDQLSALSSRLATAQQTTVTHETNAAVSS